MFFSRSQGRLIANLRSELAHIKLEKNLLKVLLTVAKMREQRIKELLSLTPHVEPIFKIGATAQGVEYLISSVYNKFDTHIAIEVYSLDGSDIFGSDFIIMAFKRADNTIEITAITGDYRFGSDAINRLTFLAQRDKIIQIKAPLEPENMTELEKLTELYLKNGFNVNFDYEKWSGIATKTFSTSIWN